MTTRMTTEPVAPAGARGRRPELLRVEDLKVYFPITEGLIIERHVGDVRAVDGVSFSHEARRDAGPGRRVRLRQEHDRPRDHPAVQADRRPDHVRRAGHDHARPATSCARLRRRMQMIFQDPYASLNPRMTAGGIIGEPLDIHDVGDEERAARAGPGAAGDGRAQPRLRATAIPHEFSGGQRQRIGVARALALDPDLIVADEPISALDVSIQAQVINLLERLQGRLGLTYLFIAHDLSVVRHISDRIAVMYLGRIVELAPSRELNREPLHPYTVALLSAVPIPDPEVERRRRRIILRGDVPSPVNPPSGCHFHTRCWLRERLGNPERCSAEVPVAARARRPATRWRATSPRRSRARRSSCSRPGATRPGAADPSMARAGGCRGHRTRDGSSRRRRGRSAGAAPPTTPPTAPSPAAGGLDSGRAAAADRPRPARATPRGPRGQPRAPSRAARRGAGRRRRPGRVPGARADRLPAPGPRGRGRDAARRPAAGRAGRRDRAGCRRSCRSWRSRPTTGCSSRRRCSRTARSATSTARCHLPTYGLFDERRFFAPGDQLRATPSRLGVGVGLAICEDFWHLSTPQLLALDGAQILVNVSSSPGRDLAAHRTRWASGRRTRGGR